MYRFANFSASEPPATVALSRYMNRIFLLMSAGIIVSAAAAAAVVDNAALRDALFTATGVTGVGWAIMLAPLLIVVTISAGVHRIRPSTARALFFLYAALVGLSLGGIAYAATGESLATTFLATAGAFVILALVGWTARADFSPFGTFFLLSLIALVLLMVLNVAIGSRGLDILLSAGAIVLFAALTAFGVQRLKRLYAEGDVRTATVGALTLYLDFLNMFLSLLRFTGRARR